MRKHIRNQMRKIAEVNGVKASTFVHNEFDRHQIKEVGATTREINKAKGTHKRRTRKQRIATALEK